MRAFVLSFLATLLVSVAADYSGGSNGYSSGGYSSGGGYPSSSGGYSSGGGYPSSGGYSSGGRGGGAFGGNTNYIQVAPGPSTYEGQYVDGNLLEKIRLVLLKEEQNSGSQGGFGGSHGGLGGFGSSGGSGGYPSSSYGAPSSSYGAPSSSYGAPSSGGRVSNIELDPVKPAIQIAQFESQQQGGSGLSSSYGAPSSSYGAPSSSYGAPSHY